MISNSRVIIFIISLCRSNYCDFFYRKYHLSQPRSPTEYEHKTVYKWPRIAAIKPANLFHLNSDGN